MVSTVYNHTYTDVVDVTMHVMSGGHAKILDVLLATNGHCSLSKCNASFGARGTSEYFLFAYYTSSSTVRHLGISSSRIMILQRHC